MYAFTYSDEYQEFDYGPSHPVNLRRLKLAYELMDAYGLFDGDDVSLVGAEAASETEALTFHSPHYLAFLRRADEAENPGADPPDPADAKRYNLGEDDNPLFPGVYRWGLLCVGATLEAARRLADGSARIAFNICGGMHHALPSHASGFCYLNDPVIAIRYFQRRGYRVAYVDLDVHHGDGVEFAFRARPDVLTISVHESGQYLFPGTGDESEIGEGEGRGYALNVPLLPESDDTLLRRAFEEIAAPLIEAFKPDVLVSQLGVDSFRSDPLADLNVTTNGFMDVVQRLRGLSPRWLALGGGGYDIFNVARAWTLAWGCMIGAHPPDEAPQSFLRALPPREAERCRRLRDAPFTLPPDEAAAPTQHLDRVIRSLREQVFPIHGLPT